MRSVNMLEAKTNLSKLVEAVESGAESEIILARNGKPVARITAVPQGRPIRLGLAEGVFGPFDLDPDLDAQIARLFTGGPIFPDDK